MRFACGLPCSELLCFAVVLTAVGLSPSALAAELLACQAKDAVNLQKDGTLKSDSVAQRAAQGSLVIDLSNGEVRSNGEQESLKMTVRQHGNETVLVPTFAPEFVRNVIIKPPVRSFSRNTFSTFLSRAPAHRFNENGSYLRMSFWVMSGHFTR